MLHNTSHASLLSNPSCKHITINPPKGIALNGYWGTGKTSALLQLYKALTGVSLKEKIPKTSPVIPIWFEAWRYQHEAMPIVALLHEIRAAFSLWNKVLEKSGDIAGITFLGVLGAFDETIKAISGGVMSPKLGDLPKIAAEYEKERYRTHLASQDLSNLLEQAIETALGKNKKLVIFIDDLDRCHSEPEAALKNYSQFLIIQLFSPFLLTLYKLDLITQSPALYNQQNDKY